MGDIVTMAEKGEEFVAANCLSSRGVSGPPTADYTENIILFAVSVLPQAVLALRLLLVPHEQQEMHPTGE